LRICKIIGYKASSINWSNNKARLTPEITSASLKLARQWNLLLQERHQSSGIWRY